MKKIDDLSDKEILYEILRTLEKLLDVLKPQDAKPVKAK